MQFLNAHAASLSRITNSKGIFFSYLSGRLCIEILNENNTERELGINFDIFYYVKEKKHDDNPMESRVKRFKLFSIQHEMNSSTFQMEIYVKHQNAPVLYLSNRFFLSQLERILIFKSSTVLKYVILNESSSSQGLDNLTPMNYRNDTKRMRKNVKTRKISKRKKK